MLKLTVHSSAYFAPLISCAGVFKQSMGARTRVGIGLSYRPARLHSQWRNWFFGIDSWLLKSLKFGLISNSLFTSLVHCLHSIYSLLLIHSSSLNYMIPNPLLTYQVNFLYFKSPLFISSPPITRTQYTLYCRFPLSRRHCHCVLS